MTPGTSGSHTYAFDASGNLTTLPTGTSATSYDNASELTSSTLSGTTTAYTYDADGERTQEAHGMTTTISAGYNGAQELTAYNNAAADMKVACYDGDGLRQTFSTSSTSCSSPTETFTWDPTGSLPHLLMDSDNAYIYGPSNTPIEQVDLSSQRGSWMAATTYPGRGTLISLRTEDSALWKPNPFSIWRADKQILLDCHNRRHKVRV